VTADRGGQKNRNGKTIAVLFYHGFYKVIVESVTPKHYDSWDEQWQICNDLLELCLDIRYDLGVLKNKTFWVLKINYMMSA
jgi:hypothetical protein